MPIVYEQVKVRLYTNKSLVKLNKTFAVNFEIKLSLYIASYQNISLFSIINFQYIILLLVLKIRIGKDKIEKIRIPKESPTQQN
jgi:hypothetical protein